MSALNKKKYFELHFRIGAEMPLNGFSATLFPFFPESLPDPRETSSTMRILIKGFRFEELRAIRQKTDGMPEATDGDLMEKRISFYITKTKPVLNGAVFVSIRALPEPVTEEERREAEHFGRSSKKRPEDMTPEERALWLREIGIPEGINLGEEEPM